MGTTPEKIDAPSHPNVTDEDVLGVSISFPDTDSIEVVSIPDSIEDNSGKNSTEESDSSRKKENGGLEHGENDNLSSTTSIEESETPKPNVEDQPSTPQIGSIENIEIKNESFVLEGDQGEEEDEVFEPNEVIIVSPSTSSTDNKPIDSDTQTKDLPPPAQTESVKVEEPLRKKESLSRTDEYTVPSPVIKKKKGKARYKDFDAKESNDLLSAFVDAPVEKKIE